jgi:hypothetical protein
MIEEFGKAKLDFFKRFLELPHEGYPITETNLTDFCLYKTRGINVLSAPMAGQGKQCWKSGDKHYLKAIRRSKSKGHISICIKYMGRRTKPGSGIIEYGREK